MPEFWADVMLWLDTSYIPVWIVCGVFTAYFAFKLWRDLRLPPP